MRRGGGDVLGKTGARAHQQVGAHEEKGGGGVCVRLKGRKGKRDRAQRWGNVRRGQVGGGSHKGPVNPGGGGGGG